MTKPLSVLLLLPCTEFHVFFNATQTEKVVREFPLLKKSNRLEFPLYTTDLKEANATTADIKMDSNAYRTCIFRYGREFRDGPAVGDTIVLVKRRGKYVMLVQRAGAKPPPGGGRQRAAGGAAAAAPATSSAAKRPAEPSAAQPSPPAKAARTQGPGSGSAKQQQPQQPLPTDLDYSCELLGMIKGTLQILDALQAGPDLRQLVLARLQVRTSMRHAACLPAVFGSTLPGSCSRLCYCHC